MFLFIQAVSAWDIDGWEKHKQTTQKCHISFYLKLFMPQDRMTSSALVSLTIIVLSLRDGSQPGKL